ncbi:hypothetical protein [Ferrovibrio sp.]|uniref:hypothetical protein n=1 Tax=Ferrovibrio sp. TaxID=1917215 RepID=UPI0035B0E497
MRALFAVTALLLAGYLQPALARDEPCPPAGERFFSNNYVQKSTLESRGERDPLLGCKFTRLEDGSAVHLRYMGSLTPLDQVKPEPKQDLVGAPPAGVYACDAPISIGGMIMGSPQTGLMFGLIDQKRYRNFDGGTGAYRFDPAQRLLTMTSGPLKGQRYLRSDTSIFKPLNDAGSLTGNISCPLSPAKPINGRW